MDLMIEDLMEQLVHGGGSDLPWAGPVQAQELSIRRDVRCRAQSRP